MVTDEELGTRWGAELHEELDGLRAPAGLATTVALARVRRAWAYAGAVAAPVLAGAVALVLALGSGGAGRAGGGAPQAGAGQPRNVAYVVAQSEKALGTADQYVVHTVTTLDGGSTQDTWADGAGTGSVSTIGPAGAPQRAYLMTVHGDELVLLDVYYPARTWSRSVLPKRVDMPAGAFGVPYGDPAEIRRELASGNLSLVGTEQVAGFTTDHLRMNLTGEDAKQAGMDLWIDEASYLPVKMSGHKGSTHFTVSFEWLPRSPENLAKIQLTPPVGFTEVPFSEEGGGASASPSSRG